MLADVELRELRIFLPLAAELHFGRTAEPLSVSQPSVSDAIRLLERRVGTRLFERTSRRVSLTPAGAELQLRLSPVIESLDRALGDARDSANGVSGVLRAGTTYTTMLPPVRRLGRAFRDRYPHCALDFDSVSIKDPWTPLRRGQLDVLINWLPVGEPDLTDGPALACYDRVVAVWRGHRLAAQESVSVEELADEVVYRPPPAFPAASADAAAPRWDWGPAGPPAPETETSGTEGPADYALPGPGQPVGFAVHIRPLFRARDRQSMSFAFDLWSYDDVRAHAADIARRLKDGTMPCDGAWSAARIEVFQRWADTGLQP